MSMMGKGVSGARGGCAVYVSITGLSAVVAWFGAGGDLRNLVPGLVIGLLYPFIFFLYYSRNLARERDRERGAWSHSEIMPYRSLAYWLLPTIFLHFIVVFGFAISLHMKPCVSSGPGDTIFTCYWDYASHYRLFRDEYAAFPNLSDAGKQDILAHFQNYVEDVSAADDAKIAAIVHRIRGIPYLVAFAFGFLGALLYSLRDAVHRSNSADLYPKTYIFYLVRFVVATTVSVCLAYFVFDVFPLNLAPVVFLLIGYFPDRIILYLDDQLSRRLGLRSDTYKPLPLGMIRGISDYKIFRLREIGISDVQNLATANLKYLKENLPYGTQTLCDWVAQGMLCVHFPDNMQALRNYGIGNILELEQCLKDMDDEQRTLLARNLQMHPEQLVNVERILKLDYYQNQFQWLRTSMEERVITEGVS